MSAKPDEKNDQFAKNTAARLAAVQAIYQNFHNKKPAQELLEEYLYSKKLVEFEDGSSILPDGNLLKRVILGVCENHKGLEEMIYQQTNKESVAISEPSEGDLEDSSEEENKSIARQFEPLLMAVLLCGTFETVVDQVVDIPIIINDYVEISKGFYAGGESGLVNGVLDSLSKCAP